MPAFQLRLDWLGDFYDFFFDCLTSLCITFFKKNFGRTTFHLAGTSHRFTCKMLMVDADGGGEQIRIPAALCVGRLTILDHSVDLN